MHTWRLLEVKADNAFMNMAIDEAILTAHASKQVPNTLRLYQWSPSAVSIGKFQNPQNEVNLANCQKLGVSVVRRVSGGGTVYHDEQGELTFCVTTSTQDLGVRDIASAYLKVYDGIKDALRLLGVSADFSEGDEKNCPNLTVNNKKISGSAQTRKSGTVMQHGTLLLDVDLEKMFSLIRVPWAKSLEEILSIARKRITSVKNEVGHAVSAATATNAILVGFRNALRIELDPGELTAFEKKTAERLYKDKYSTGDWNLDGKSILG